MKLPAVCLAAAFASGVALGLFTPLSAVGLSANLVRATFFVALALLSASAILLRKNRVNSAGGISLAAWLTLGLLSSWFASLPEPANHILNLSASSHLDLSSPLRWHARLRDEPSDLLWGTSYDLALDSVEFEGDTITTTGGMRLSYSPHGDTAQLPPLHAGDSISFIAQARSPQLFRDEGAFDRRAYLRQQGIDLTATLRSPALIERENAAKFSIHNSLAHVRSHLRNELNGLFPNSPEVVGVLRAMLLGDRSFVERDESAAFQKTGVFHVLVVAGLHVGAFAVFLYWLGRRFRISIGWTTLLILAALACYVALIEQRPPVLRAALMAVVLLAGGYFFRKLELLNSAAIAALLLLIAQPIELRDSSFQLSFLSIGCIAGIAVPWIDRTVEPYLRGLRGWRDVTRDASHTPSVIQFRIDLRSVASLLATKVPPGVARFSGDSLAIFLRTTFRVWELLALTLVLQIGMLPLMARDFHRVTLLGALANLLAVPLTGILVPAGFVVLTTGAISKTFAGWIAIPLRWLTAFLIHSVTYFSHLPHGSYRIPGPPFWLVILFFALALCLSVLLRVNTQHRRLLLAACVCNIGIATALIALHPFPPLLHKGQLELTVLDVGQGDSLFLVSPAGHTLLIDGGGQPPNYGEQGPQRGPDPGEDAVSPYLWSRGIKRIDIVALTHAHQDHLGGLQAVLENLQIGTLWIGREVSTPAFAQLESVARARGIPIVYEQRGKTFDWDGVEGEVLWPDSQQSGEITAAKNNDSLVIHLKFRNRSFFLPGDAELQAEFAMLSGSLPAALQADVLKVGHHGSKNSTTPELLAAVHPQWAIISTGAENPYGHPNEELLQRLQNAGVRVLRTDRDGAVHILTDGERLEVSCFLNCGQFLDLPASAAAQPPNQKQKSQ